MLLQSLSGSFALFGEAALFSWVFLFFLGLYNRHKAHVLLPFIFALGSLSTLFFGYFSPSFIFSFPFPFSLGGSQIAFIIDPLSRWFLMILGAVGVPLALFAPGYFSRFRDRISIGYVWSALSLLFLSMAGVLLAANALVFLVMWEIMALSSFILVATNHGEISIRRAAFIYLGATRVGTTFLMAGFLWAHTVTGTWTISLWHVASPENLAELGPALLIFIGFGTKAGCWPFHIWLPTSYSAAPAPITAVLSGAVMKTAVYAFLRFFLAGTIPPSLTFSLILVVFGAISALWGILFALLKTDLKRILAYSSIENFGLLLLAMGLAGTGKALQLPLLANLALSAALFHALNHALFKSMLFYVVGSVELQAGTYDGEHLGGLIHRMPWTAGAFLLGSAALCALPPLNGFASEFLLYQGLFELVLNGGGFDLRLGAVLLLALLALVGALAIACFVKAIGIVFLGAPRTKEAAEAIEAPVSMRFSQYVLGALCIALGLGAPFLLSRIQIVTSSMIPNALSAPVVPNLPMGIIALSLATLLLLIFCFFSLLAWRRPARRFVTWECGFGVLGPRTQYTGTSFAQPMASLFSSLYSYRLHITHEGSTDGETEDFRRNIRAETAHEAYLETCFYGPVLTATVRFAEAFLTKLQAGSIHQYLFFMTIALVALIWMGYK